MALSKHYVYEKGHSNVRIKQHLLTTEEFRANTNDCTSFFK